MGSTIRLWRITAHNQGDCSGPHISTTLKATPHILGYNGVALHLYGNYSLHWWTPLAALAVSRVPLNLGTIWGAFQVMTPKI